DRSRPLVVRALPDLKFHITAVPVHTLAQHLRLEPELRLDRVVINAVERLQQHAPEVKEDGADVAIVHRSAPNEPDISWRILRKPMRSRWSVECIHEGAIAHRPRNGLAYCLQRFRKYMPNETRHNMGRALQLFF